MGERNHVRRVVKGSGGGERGEGEGKGEKLGWRLFDIGSTRTQRE